MKRARKSFAARARSPAAEYIEICFASASLTVAHGVRRDLRPTKETVMQTSIRVRLVRLGEARTLTRGQWHEGVLELDGTYIRMA